MHLLRIEAINYRNLAGEFEFSPGLNIVNGANAQGKTSLLEAIYILGTTKSFRTSYPRESIAHDADEAILRGVIRQGESGNLTKELQLLLKNSGGGAKQVFVNGKREALTRYLGSLDAISFTSGDMDIVRGSPDARRKFLDRGIFGIMPSYLGMINEYNRVLKQKNALLREASNSDHPNQYLDSIQPWNDQLVALGTEIHKARVDYTDKLGKMLRPELFQNESITIKYKSSLEGKGDLSDYTNLFHERLNLRLKNEIGIGYSLVGPHRDDLEIRFDGHEIARYGSSGQQRSALLILDLAQIGVYYQVFEEYPLFLIDDLDAELDRTRIDILLRFLEGKSQTIVSTSKQTIADRYADRAQLIFMHSGRKS